MKIEVEIKDGKFIYVYEVGTSKSTSEMELNADLLCLFTSLVSSLVSSLVQNTVYKKEDTFKKFVLEKVNEVQK